MDYILNVRFNIVTEKMQTTLLIIRNFTWMLYAGPMIGFCLLLFVTPAHNRVTRVQTFQAFGPIFGISLGLCIYAAIAHHWIVYEHFYMSWETQKSQIMNAGVLCGLAMWISNIKLEVWTLDPFRKISPDTEQDKYKKLIPSLQNHLVVHVLLVIGTTILCGLGEII